MKNPVARDAIASNNKYYFPTVLIIPAIALVMLTGCSTLGGGASGDPAPTTTNKIYLEQHSSVSDPVAASPDPGYEWFY
jgi:hypothetical protein